MKAVPALALLAALALAAGAGDAAQSAQTTLARTIVDRHGDNRLEFGPGEPYSVRAELAQPQAGREARRSSLVFFAQMTDFQIVDEESPARVEYLDKFGDEFTAAYRPQEGLVPHVVNESVKQLRAAMSPLGGRRVELVMTTGDNVDNTQRNETRWLVDLLDGGADVAPNSGVPGTCGSRRDGHVYDGVRGGGEYHEPDRSAAPGKRGVDGLGYSPRAAENRKAVGRAVSVRDFPGLLEQMNLPFRAVGLGVPWYSVFGNHDALIQGNVPGNTLFTQLAVGCKKLVRLSPRALAEIAPLLRDGLTADERGRVAQIVTRDTVELLLAPKPPRELVAQVPSDRRRALLTKSEYMSEHLRTRGRPAGHGFTQENVTSGQGDYSFRPKPGLRFAVLDTVSETGGAGGNVDDAQFRRVHRALGEAEAARELVLVFAHHSLRTMSQSGAGVHFGLGAAGATAACSTLDPLAEPPPDETLRCLLLRHPSVLAFVAGHEHRNRIAVHQRPVGPGGLWEVVTSAHIDWPQQSRLIELFDNADGTLSLFLTVVDHAAPPLPAPAGRAPTGRLAPADVARLASIARELAFNDPQESRTGPSARRGTAADRNVELLLVKP